MEKNRLVPILAIAGYGAYFVLGFVGSLFPVGSVAQNFAWQVDSAIAISANVLAGVWAARIGEDLAAAGFTMLGVVECVFFSAVTVTQVEYRTMAPGAILMIPALLMIASFRLFPTWVKAAGGAVCVLFLMQYATIVTGRHRDMDFVTQASFLSQQMVGLIWSYYFWKEFKRRA